MFAILSVRHQEVQKINQPEMATMGTNNLRLVKINRCRLETSYCGNWHTDKDDYNTTLPQLH